VNSPYFKELHVCSRTKSHCHVYSRAQGSALQDNTNSIIQVAAEKQAIIKIMIIDSNTVFTKL
jgi:hypothetical protein